MNEMANGRTIRGNHGVDVYARADGYHVEHFSLSGPETVVLWSDGPFTHQADAWVRMVEYRHCWSREVQS